MSVILLVNNAEPGITEFAKPIEKIISEELENENVTCVLFR